MEEFKLFKKIKRPNKLEIKYLISNKGNVKLVAEYNGIFVDEEILYIGNVLYIHDGNITGARLGDNIYRIVYRLFKGDIPKGYQIHHKDFNHYNNNVDNLECLSNIQHLRKHTDVGNMVQGWIEKDEEYYKWLDAKEKEDRINRIQYTIEDSKKDFDKLYKRFEINFIPIRDQYNQMKLNRLALEKEHKKEQERIDKLNSGKYGVREDGSLYLKERKKWTDERRSKTMKTRYEKVYNNEEWRDNISKRVTEYFEDQANRDRLSASMKRYYKNKKALL